MNLFNNLTIIQHLKESLRDVTDSVEELAAELNVSALLFFLVGAAFAIVIGMLGYRMSRVMFAIGFAGFGFMVGIEVFNYMLTFESMATMPGFTSYIVGGVLALGFFFLGFFKCSYAFFAAIFMVLSNFVWEITDNIAISLGLALVVAVIAVMLFRVSVVLVTSFGAGIVIVGALGQFLPKVPMLQVAAPKNDFGLLIALGLGVVFAVMQFIFARYYKPARK